MYVRYLPNRVACASPTKECIVYLSTFEVLAAMLIIIISPGLSVGLLFNPLRKLSELFQGVIALIP